MNMRLLAVLIGIFTFTAIAEPAQAVLHSRMGRFMQRDPHGMRIGTYASISRISSHPVPATYTVYRMESPLQYSDGLTLYQYVKSRPLAYVDPSGLLGDGPAYITPDPGSDSKYTGRCGSYAFDPNEHCCIDGRAYDFYGPECTRERFKNFQDLPYDPKCIDKHYPAAEDAGNRQSTSLYPRDGSPKTERKRNALRHCIRACELAKKCNIIACREKLEGREGLLHQYIKPIDTWADTHNNNTGVALGLYSRLGEIEGSCKDLCVIALDEGALNTVPIDRDWMGSPNR